MICFNLIDGKWRPKRIAIAENIRQKYAGVFSSQNMCFLSTFLQAIFFCENIEEEGSNITPDTPYSLFF